MSKQFSTGENSAVDDSALEKVEAPGEEIRKLFPIFQEGGSPQLAYLDTAASSQKPERVIRRLGDYLRYQHANVHRGTYELSIHATALYDVAREQVAAFTGGVDSKTVIFTKGATESINLVARGIERRLSPGDTIVLSLLEHHSNIVPWQLLAERRGLKLVWADITDHGELDLDDYAAKVEKHRPKLVAITAISNALGTVVPLAQVIEVAKGAGSRVVVDAAQLAPHSRCNFSELGADFLVFSGHKMYGPTGIGVLVGTEEALDELEPFLGGGDMIETVTTEGSTWAPLPQKFEAGTPPIAEAIGLGEAVAFLEGVGLEKIAAHEERLLKSALQKLGNISGVHLLGPGAEGGKQRSVVSFLIEGIHAHDFATVADEMGVCVRAGHHCAMPALARLGQTASIRASLGVYSTEADVERLVAAVHKAQKLFG